MSKVSRNKTSLLAIDLIEEQLRVLPISIAMILRPAKASAAESGAAPILVLQRKNKAAKTGSAGNIVVGNAHAATVLDFEASNHVLSDNPQQQAIYLRVVISNALLAVGMFLKEHELASCLLYTSPSPRDS